MPPRNAPRSLAGEDHLADRIAAEREQRGWSYEQLAKRMTDVGCPLNQSAINKIEKGRPRRRITVDELIGFAKVFDTNIGALVLDPSVVNDAQAAQLFQEWQKAEREAAQARTAYEEHTGIYPDTVERLTQAASERPTGRRG